MLKLGIFNRQNKDAAGPMRSIRSLSELCGLEEQICEF